MNRVILTGRLVASPEYTAHLGGNNSYSGGVARYRLAVDRFNKQDGQQSADFIQCVTFGKAAEFANKYLCKGTKIAVVGRIRTGSYTNRDGNKVNTFEVVVDEHEFCESRQTATAQPSPQAQAPAPEPTYAQALTQDWFNQMPSGAYDEGLPFNG